MPRLRTKKPRAELEPEPFDGQVEAVDDLRFGKTFRFLPKGSKLPIDDAAVIAAPELFRVPARRLVKKEEANDAR